MKTLKTLSLLTATGFVLMGCPADDAPPAEDTSSTGSDTTNGPTTAPTTMTMTGADSTSTTDTATETGETDTGTTTGGEPTLPEFPALDPDAYTRVDRNGFPAINTGLNLLGDKDAYNAADPADDAALTFSTEIFESLFTLHRGIPMMDVPDNTGLDDDLMALALNPCTPPLAMGPSSCDDQAAPFGIPDVLKITVGGDPNFPNGRRPVEPVMDIILAVLLLELDLADPMDTTILTFLNLDGMGELGPSLNPLENDVPFQDSFPYLAPAHE